MSGGTPVLLEARCASGHVWDVWGEEREGHDRPVVIRAALLCPSCEPAPFPVYAETVDYPEPLA